MSGVRELKINPKWLERMRYGVPMSDYTTFKLGGPAAMLIELESPAEVSELIRELTLRKEAWRVVGGGSNLLVSDEGLEEVVIVYRSSKKHIRREGEQLIAAGGVLLADLVDFAVAEGLSGLEFLAGIPGTVGGAIYGNAGAFGQAIGKPLAEAAMISSKGMLYKAVCRDLGFKYRRSCLYETKDVVLEARFMLKAESGARINAAMDEILELRRGKHPDVRRNPCAGSFFQNVDPEPGADRRTAAGYLLEQVGAKKMQVGGAKIYPKHANIIIADKGCRSEDVINLAVDLREAVKKMFGVELMREVEIWPEQAGAKLPKYKG